MNTFYLSIGSNLDPQKNIPAALDLLRKKFPKITFSAIYETDPVGPAGDQKFWNLAAKIETKLIRQRLFVELRRLEEKLGRRRTSNKFAPRPIDLDILPQPEYQKQAFIVIPLAEIAPDEKDPATGKTFGELGREIKKWAKDFKRI